MIGSFVPSAILKTRLVDILEIVNSNNEKFLDISIVCQDGSFLWSQFLLAAASDLFAVAMQGIEVTQVIFPDLKVEDVRGSLLGLIDPSASKETDQVNDFVHLLSSPGSFSKKNCFPDQVPSDIDCCIDADFIKVEIDEAMDEEDVDLSSYYQSVPVKIEENYLEFTNKNPKPVQCPDCHEWKENYAAMYKCSREHRLQREKEHAESGNPEALTFPCQTCNKDFHTRKSLTQHRHRRHGVNLTFQSKSLHKCPHCNMTFSRRGSLTRHVKSKICTEPKNTKKIENTPTYILPMPNIPQFPPFEPNTTSNSIKLEPLPISHPDAFMEPQPISFPEVLMEPLPISLPEALMEPLPISLPEALMEPLPISLPEAFMEPLPISLPEALTSDTFSCDKCNKTFTASFRLKRHIREVCNKEKLPISLPEELEFSCQTCSKTFSTRRSLTQHRHRRHGVNSTLNSHKLELLDPIPIALQTETNDFPLS